MTVTEFTSCSEHFSEFLSHVPLIMQIFRTAVKESFDGIIPQEVIKRANQLIKEMTEAEIEWTNHVGQGMRMFTPESIDIFIKGQANSVCRNLGIELLYPDVVSKPNPLKRLIMERVSAADNTKLRSSIFEVNAMEYNKNALKDDL